ncbi:hypothetical protein NDU88_000523 [Pleurodeles waltl]|uniref:Uncharacterized protein n=1 Tax=Pleurodeles waltl TaxID=8319 RepID=A0AAV7NBK4_PLEWA|nr:hypothetical protein NDU88_000523 [Pleurodeles waltl]
MPLEWIYIKLLLVLRAKTKIPESTIIDSASVVKKWAVDEVVCGLVYGVLVVDSVVAFGVAVDEAVIICGSHVYVGGAINGMRIDDVVDFDFLPVDDVDFFYIFIPWVGKEDP